MSQNYWEVAVDAPIFSTFTYSSSCKHICPGTPVKVNFGKRSAKGVVIGQTQIDLKAVDYSIKEISEVINEVPVLSSPQVHWLKWISKYYNYPIGPVFQLPFPSLKKNGKTRKAPIISEGLEPNEGPSLTADQNIVWENINNQLESFSTHLIFGVTGSGKTEIYMRAIQKVLNTGKKAIFLVPEIALTPQLLNRFVTRFGSQIAVLHSQLTDRERTNQWWNIVDGKKNILLGTRSALFCPIDNLGIIILDEEHDSSYKQDEKFKYNARDAAIVLAKTLNIPIILGSATPSLESWQNAKEGKYKLHKIATRALNQNLPDVKIIDLRNKENKSSEKEDCENESPFWLSSELKESIEIRLKKGEQVALFLNRRGVAQTVICPGCGATKDCPNCAVSLTLHGKNHLVCHYCDYTETNKPVCTECNLYEVKPLGLGTESIENDIIKTFPDAKVLRADRDEIQSRGDLEEIISEFESGRSNVLIGTQIIAKGLDFPNLTLVGVILADIGFNVPDFRSSEKSFQLLAQVSGRPGRHEKPGEVIVQTYNPDHPSVVFAKNHDFTGFAEQELQHRSELGYPPFGRLLSFRLQGNNMKTVQKASHDLSQIIQRMKDNEPSVRNVQVLGPTEAPIHKLRGKYRYLLLLKSLEARGLNSIGHAIMKNSKWVPKGVRVLSDVDPINML